jgi:energy-coupling factor transporter ATP-binding protein EcfA2
VRRGLDTRDDAEAETLRAQLDELLADASWWSLGALKKAQERFDERVVRAFFDPITPEHHDAAAMRDETLPFPSSADAAYPRVLFIGATGSGKTTLLRQFIGTDPTTERFPSTSTAKTTIHDTEIVLTADGPFKGVVTFLGHDELRAYLTECVLAALLEANRSGTDAEVRRRLLDHVDQRHRFSYTLGRAVVPGDDEDDDEPQDATIQAAILPALYKEFERTEEFLAETVGALRELAKTHITALRSEIAADATTDQRAIDELFEETLESRVSADERFYAIVDELADLIEARFDWIEHGTIRRNRAGWPEIWEFETDDRATFIRAVSRFSSNYAPLFGTLLTPLVTGVRVSGPFKPSWSDGTPSPLVLMDGEGLGHTPTFGTALSTALSRRIDTADAVVLVDNASQPMQASAVAAIRELLARGNARKLIIAFTHFDRVTGDNLPNRSSRRDHVLASAEGAMVSIGKELGSNAERALRARLATACFFLGHLDSPLRADHKAEAHTVRALEELRLAFYRAREPGERVDARPIYDRLSFVLAVQAAVRSLFGYWQPILGLSHSTEVAPEHWTRIRALSRRLAQLLSDEYDSLKPVADLQKELQKAVFVSLQTPLGWTGDATSEEQKQLKLDRIAEAASIGLMELAKRRLWDERLTSWRDAFDQSGKGSARRRALIISNDIYDRAAPVPNAAPDQDGNEFLREVLTIVERAAQQVGAEFRQ